MPAYPDCDGLWKTECGHYLPGYIAAGESRDQVLALLREAISFHLEGLNADGQPIPEPSSSGELIEIEAAA
ncbi:MAG: type II toxin-antitoxin system HicB family antitoxin [Candidatus Methylomirabilis oxyfera]|nr:type II toxin-antitoxin system HicB family antitoxin [Candidatus Methylomirabilis oxyfera]